MSENEQKNTPSPADSGARPSVRLTGHARDRAGSYGLTGLDLLGALGPNLAEDGALACRRSDTQADGHPPTPEPGDPILIGRQYLPGEPVKSLLLGVTPAGRRIHLTVAAIDRKVIVVTLWCPDDPENRHRWVPDGLLPTNLGARTLPPTHWYLGDPFAPARLPLRGGVR